MSILVLADLALTDADLRKRHPRIDKDRWQGVASYADQFSIAWDELIIDLKARAWDTDLVLKSTTNTAWAKQAVIYKTLRNVFLDWMSETGDVWATLAADYESKYKNMLENAKLDYDADEDGSISEAEEKTANTTLLLR